MSLGRTMRAGSMLWTPGQDDAIATRYDGTGGVVAAADPMADMAPGDLADAAEPSLSGDASRPRPDMGPEDQALSIPDLWQFAEPIRLGLPVASADAGAMPDTPVWTAAPLLVDDGLDGGPLLFREAPGCGCSHPIFDAGAAQTALSGASDPGDALLLFPATTDPLADDGSDPLAFVPPGSAVALQPPGASLTYYSIGEMGNQLATGFWDWRNSSTRAFNMSDSGASAKNGVLH